MERIRRFIRELSERQWIEQMGLRDWTITRSTYKTPGLYEDMAPYPEGDKLDRFPSRQGTTYFFRKQLELPVAWSNETVGLIFESGGEGLLRINGRSHQGLDRNHKFVTLDPARMGTTMELEIELFDPIPEPVDPLNQQAVIQPPITSIRSMVVRVNKPVQSLLYTVMIVRDSMVLLPEEDFRRTRLMQALYRAMDRFVAMNEAAIRIGQEVEKLEEDLVREVREIGGNAEGTEHMVGQSHIDIAWLWPVRETVRKTSRTFSTMDALMEEYPEFKYAQSQPLLFQFLKDNDPELFERVKARIAEGRWELVGGMWVEPDLNIPSGESLMRQMLYGQRFYQEEFGKTSDIEWLPDTFGYCASLPQILKHGGIRYFMTTKLGWNDTNVFPYDLFHWVGIDGTPMLSYLNHGVNENTLPKDIHDHWQSYRQKDVHQEQMLLYGHGDGGGGVTREMLEYIDRSELMIGQPSSRYSTAADFFRNIDEKAPKLPTWRGDLYLELHRGTYTTHGRNKRHNRRAEMLYREAELWNALAEPVMEAGQLDRIKEKLHDGWKLILLNQFHDIIPGSAITESYVTSEKEYGEVFEKGNSSLEQGISILAAQVNTEGDGMPYLVFNSLGWSRDAVISIDCDAQPDKHAVYDAEGTRLESDASTDEAGRACIIVRVPEIPAFGCKTIWVRSIETPVEHTTTTSDSKMPGSSWETAYYKIQFNDRGEIVSLYDKEADREVVKHGEQANRFHFFHDRPTLWDAWDIDTRYEEQVAGEAELLEKRVVLSGKVKDVIRFRWRLNQSEITQDMILYHQDRRIDFETHVSWNESHKLLKVGFPIDVIAEKATYEIPFGTIERPTHRNTSWEQAQYEVCGHRFADVSEFGYGVSLLNDCKYGYDVQGSTIRLSLLRAPKWPDITADLGEHQFTYSLYPHKGDWREAHTFRKAAELNYEIPVHAAEPKQGLLPSTHSWIPFESKHVVLDTVKLAEDGSGVILRWYEASGGRESITLRWPHSCVKVYQSNALEEEGEILPHEDGVITLSLAPYEIQTVKLVYS
ncbi:alpha-mannosidase [Paenibacillus dakarensis]|uniref:alpha-mannosidase n=1 Tax=Paenibacillus dakarensis TaxID=1527293 RepID=UPI0006D5513F|nr:alpha-mannosidase [Paenibacillus dakarensis]